MNIMRVDVREISEHPYSKLVYVLEDGTEFDNEYDFLKYRIRKEKEEKQKQWEQSSFAYRNRVEIEDFKYGYPCQMFYIKTSEEYNLLGILGIIDVNKINENKEGNKNWYKVSEFKGQGWYIYNPDGILAGREQDCEWILIKLDDYLASWQDSWESWRSDLFNELREKELK